MSNFSMLEFMKCTEFSMIFSGVILKRGVDYSIEFDSRVHIEFISRVIWVSSWNECPLIQNAAADFHNPYHLLSQRGMHHVV